MPLPQQTGTPKIGLADWNTMVGVVNDNEGAIADRALKTQITGTVIHDGTTTGGTRPTGYARVVWVGGTTRPTNMATNDYWEHDA